MNYWAIGSSATTAPYFYFEKIETSDGKAVKADRSNASSLDFYVKPTNFYKDGVSTVGTLNTQIIFAPEKAAEILKKLLLDGREHQVISAWQLLLVA